MPNTIVPARQSKRSIHALSAAQSPSPLALRRTQRQHADQTLLERRLHVSFQLQLGRRHLAELALQRSELVVCAPTLRALPALEQLGALPRALLGQRQRSIERAIGGRHRDQRDAALTPRRFVCPACLCGRRARRAVDRQTEADRAASVEHFGHAHIFSSTPLQRRALVQHRQIDLRRQRIGSIRQRMLLRDPHLTPR